MIGSDAKHIALAGPAQHPFNCANAIDAIGGDPGERRRRDGALDHGDGESWLGCESRFLRDMGRLHARRIICPCLWQIKRPVDEGMAMPRDITGEDADLAVRDLARRAGILPPNATRSLALLQESGFIEDQNRVVVGERLKRIVPHGIAQVVGFPPAAA